MIIDKTNIDDLIIINPKRLKDDRGYFQESYKKEYLDKFLNEKIDFIQINESLSYKNVIRGLHFQSYPYEQTKLVKVNYGKILDVVVDLRKKSKSYGNYYSIILSSKNRKQLLIPKGFAHGFSVLSKYAIISYQVDNEYNKKSENGYNCFDPYFNIDWMVNKKNVIISDKDLSLPNFTL